MGSLVHHTTLTCISLTGMAHITYQLSSSVLCFRGLQVECSINTSPIFQPLMDLTLGPPLHLPSQPQCPHTIKKREFLQNRSQIYV